MDKKYPTPYLLFLFLILVHQSIVWNVQNPPGIMSAFRVMGDHDDGPATLVEHLEEFHDFLGHIVPLLYNLFSAPMPEKIV